MVRVSRVQAAQQRFSVFYKSRSRKDGTEEKLIIGCYVDDLCCLYDGDQPGSLYSDFVAALQSRWNVEDEGPVSDLLNVEFSRSADNGIKLSQGSYIDRMVQRYLPSGESVIGKNVPPCDAGLEAAVQAAVLEREKDRSIAPDAEILAEYQALLGSLLYCVTNTRPDAGFAVGMLGRAMACPNADLLERARNVLRYLRAHRDVGLHFAPNCQQPLYGMSDANWATRHSTTGFVFQLGQACISWCSKKQPSVALSSCEAEIMAASEASKEAIYLRNFLEELDEGSAEATALSVDNKAARDLAYNPEHHQKTKHIERRHFHIREVVESGRLVVPFVASADNLADFFTKSLDAPRFFVLRDRIMNIPCA